MGIRLIRRAIREGRYEFTVHALEEMDEDALGEAGVRQAILHGRLGAELTDDPRGSRFVVRGRCAVKPARSKWCAASCRPACCV